MKRVLFVFLMSLSFVCVKAQNKNPYKHYSDSLGQLKKQGKLTGEEWFYNPNATKGLKITESKNHTKKKGSNNRVMSSTACNCWIQRDASFQTVAFDGSGGNDGPGTAPNYANDDWSTNAIILPFNFCFYSANAGTSANPLYINNNGNISFGAPYSVFSAVPFPSSSYSMIAPFWSDVDTDNPGSGFSYYQLTPHHLIVQWDSVTRYDDPGLVNTYQVIITDGTDSILPPGNNIAFCFGEMQWTTGDASGGTNGFGGTPATIGINKGDGVSYTQIGLFNTSGSTYTSYTATNSGVGYLPGKSYYFNSCGSGSNSYPIVTSGGPTSACAGGDTLGICAVGDTLYHTVTFIPPSTAQTVSITASSPNIGAGFFISSSTSGTTGSLTFAINSSSLTATPGFYTVTVTATNTGSPPLSTTINYVIHILGSAIPNPSITVTPSVTCGSTPPIITLANNSAYSSWTWSTGATTYTTSVATTSTVQVTVTENGCQKTGSVFVPIYSVPHPVIGGSLTYCPPSTSTDIYVHQPISGGTAPYIYNWQGGLPISSTTNDTLQATDSSSIGSGTSYTVVVTDAHGCTDSTSVTITHGSVTPLSITSHGSLCGTPGHDTLFSSITNATSYTWSPNVGSANNNPTYLIGGTSNIYTLALIVNNCPVTQTISISNPVPPSIQTIGDTVLCGAGDSTTLTAIATPTASSGYTYNWYNGSTSISTTNTVTISVAGNTFSVTVVNNNTQCENSKTFTVNVYNNPSVLIGGNFTYCKGHGDSLSANPSGGNAPYTYSWTPGSVTTQTINAVPPTSVTQINYSVVVTDSKGCMATTYQNIKQSNPTLHMQNAYICPGNVANMHAHGSGTNPLTYVWYPDSISGATYSTSIPGTYTVVLTDAYDCHDSVAVSVIRYPKPQASFSYTPTTPEQGSSIYFTDNSTISSPDSVVWDTWYFGDLDTVVANFNPTHTYVNGGTYTVTLIVASEFGCLDTITKVISIQYNVIAPNIITPNGDGINEFLAFKNLQYFPNSKIWIYNRWGTQLYHSDDYKNDWTGKDYSDGTYFYLLEVSGKDETLKGFFESIK